eukprot:Gb_15423 [translate_table: standard]
MVAVFKNVPRGSGEAPNLREDRFLEILPRGEISRPRSLREMRVSTKISEKATGGLVLRNGTKRHHHGAPTAQAQMDLEAPPLVRVRALSGIKHKVAMGVVPCDGATWCPSSPCQIKGKRGGPSPLRGTGPRDLATWKDLKALPVVRVRALLGNCDVVLATIDGGVSQIKALAGDAIGGEDLLQNVIGWRDHLENCVRKNRRNLVVTMGWRLRGGKNVDEDTMGRKLPKA